MHDRFTSVAEAAAREAGHLIRDRIGRAREVGEKTSNVDLVTEVDKQSEAVIRTELLAAFPEHKILGEEGVAPGSAASAEALAKALSAEYLWIVDPIDGTTNFVHGFPGCTVSIALAHRGEVIAGVIYDPLRDEMFSARRGGGAYMNGEPIHVSEEETLSVSLLATGFPGDREWAREVNLRGMAALTPVCRNIRAAGSAALHMAYVACGRLSGFWEIDLNAWDLAAGSLLVQEAGGRVTDTEGNEYNLEVRHIAATNGHIHNQLIRVLEQADATGL
ncbi:inositol monophosphatase family protein [Effusibacillus lacus]|uniref:Inositol-1-monophosphatase n=1 Tax=Effusibacillus lacus TaxID=1348429 RepID=A0A292YP05_9BACL|nr:inositol monophosphatase family protein [Effusibacillus lacus]TCS72337.1 myo-inositol-1(or 4)-monophosphatase [Effusibacillus lacus]GAX90200.1 inositol monophosphatase [Effusibacillus lacus]